MNEVLDNLPSREDIVITGLGMVSGIRITQEGGLFCSGEEFYVPHDTKELYRMLKEILRRHDGG